MTITKRLSKEYVIHKQKRGARCAQLIVYTHSRRYSGNARRQTGVVGGEFRSTCNGKLLCNTLNVNIKAKASQFHQCTATRITVSRQTIAMTIESTEYVIKHRE